MTKLADLKALMAKATQGPWKAGEHESYGKTYAVGAPKRCQLAKFYAQPGNGGQIKIEPSEMYANGRLTVSMYNALPDLIAAVEALKALEDKLAELEPALIDVHAFAQNHGVKWTGGNWVDERANARAALAKLGE